MASFNAVVLTVLEMYAFKVQKAGYFFRKISSL